jgi:hypothetical protein
VLFPRLRPSAHAGGHLMRMHRSKSVPPTLPSRQGAAPVCADRMADPISLPDGPDSSPHPRCPSDSRSLPPPDSTTHRSSQPLHVPPHTKAKPIKDQAPALPRNLVHCAVNSIPRASAFAPYPGFPRPRNRANLFQSFTGLMPGSGLCREAAEAIALVQQ